MRAAFIAPLALAACETATPAGEGLVQYGGVETRLLEDNLVNLRVRMTGVSDPDQVLDYAQCAAAQYALIRGYGFARNVRTLVDEEGGIWTGDAVYTISPALPRGLRTIDAEVTVADCASRSIPTV